MADGAEQQPPPTSMPEAAAETAAGAGDQFEVAWARVQERWSEADAHGAFLALAADLGKLGDAAGRYRSIAEASDESAERREEARERLTVAVTLAVQLMEGTRTKKLERPIRPLVFVAAGIMIVLGLALIWAASR